MPTPVILFCARCEERLLSTDVTPQYFKVYDKEYPSKLRAFFFGNSPSDDVNIEDEMFSWMKEKFSFGKIWEVIDQDGRMYCELRCRDCTMQLGELTLKKGIVKGRFVEIEFSNPGKDVIHQIE